MYARVWKFDVLPERMEEFTAITRANVALIRKYVGFRGFIMVRGGLKDSPECNVVSVWDSLEALRASEDEAFQQAAARALACCKPGTALQEEDVLICDFVRDAKPKRLKPSKRRVKSRSPKRRVRRRAS